jgi:hypothetical protein
MKYSLTKDPIRVPTYNSDGTITIYTAKGHSVIIDAIDGDLAKFNWKSSIRKSGDVYVTRTFFPEGYKGKQKMTLLHRVIMERIAGQSIDPRVLVDHVDLNTLNNTRSNLRLATHSQNTQNQRKRNNCTSPYKGVCWNKSVQKWQASIKLNGKNHYLGLFNDPTEAHKAYKEKSIELFGEFARFE